MRTPLLAAALACLAAASSHRSADRPAGRLDGRQAPAACQVSPASPSLAPVYVYDGAPNQTAFAASPDRVARISDTHSAVFGFGVPAGGFPPPPPPPPPTNTNATAAGAGAANATCALQFRLPYCGDLPPGYPCYVFSGLEQEVLAGSGVRFRRVVGEAPAGGGGGGTGGGYEDEGTVQVFPGANVTVGTFACGAGPGAAAPAGGGLWWLAESERGLRLEFLQGGGASGFEGGVGAWVVACS